jgi:hypothetical protein
MLRLVVVGAHQKLAEHFHILFVAGLANARALVVNIVPATVTASAKIETTRLLRMSPLFSLR